MASSKFTKTIKAILCVSAILMTVNIVFFATRSVRKVVIMEQTQFKIHSKDTSLLNSLTNGGSDLFSLNKTNRSEITSINTDGFVKIQHESVAYNETSARNEGVSDTYGTCHHGDRFVRLPVKPETYRYFTADYTIAKEPARSVLSENMANRFCGGKVVSYGNQIATLHDVVMFPMEKNDNGVVGGEQVIAVLNQHVQKEHYQFRKGFLKVSCPANDSLREPTGNVNKWLKTVRFEHSEINVSNMTINEKFVIAVEREDYANLHNWARGVFNTFLMMVRFNIQPQQLAVVFLDAHPFSSLDTAWEEIFGTVLRVGHLKTPVLYRNLIFTFSEGGGPVSDYHNKYIGETEEYREFVLSRHRVNSHGARLSCPRIKITLIIRRNAVYHPRNTMGNVGRKIFNEAEIVQALMTSFPRACVQAVMMETLPFHLQLEVISQTDVLIGMHGAGMSHTLFLPQHAAVLELFPKGFKDNRPWFECYQAIARWRGLKYDSWENFDQTIEMPHDYTILPAHIVVEKAKGLVDKLCN